MKRFNDTRKLDGIMKYQFENSYYQSSLKDQESHRDLSNQGRINMKTNKNVDEFWNGKDRSLSKEKNKWF